MKMNTASLEANEEKNRELDARANEKCSSCGKERYKNCPHSKVTSIWSNHQPTYSEIL